MGDIQMDQSSYVKSFTEEFHMIEYVHTKKVCIEQNISKH